MFRAPLYAGITRVGPNHVFLAVQQLVDLGNVCNVGRRPHYAVHQAGLGIGADMCLHAEEVLVALLRLVHLRITLAFPVLGRTRRMNDRGINDGALAQ
ncbi:hypothetical protein D9M73_226690 [compost metagenome]